MKCNETFVDEEDGYLLSLTDAEGDEIIINDESLNVVENNKKKKKKTKEKIVRNSM